MADTERDLGSDEPTILVEEIQKTIELGIRDGRIDRKAVPGDSAVQASGGILQTTTGFILNGMARFRYLFSRQENNERPPDDTEPEEFDSFMPLQDTSEVDIEKLKLGLIDDDFRREGLIASGGQADIVKAKDKQIGRIVAVKCLRDVCKSKPGASSVLMHEAVLAARLEHPTIIPVYRLCRDPESNLHIVMKKIRGKTLAKYLDELRDYYQNNRMRIFEERASLSRRLDIFLDICNGLGYAHGKRVVHCDLKPANVMIGFHRETYIIDWGIAKVLDENGAVPGARKIVGTPYYIAPEVACGLAYDRRADVFAMGAILFEMVTLKKAFPGKEAKVLLENICTGNMNPIKHVHGAGIDKALVHIIRKATATHPDARYQRIEDLAEDIRRYRSGLGIMAKPDNIFQHAGRWMLIHKRFTLWAAQVFLAAVIGVIGYNIYEKMELELLQKRRETSLNSAYTKSLVVVMEINSLLNKTEQLVQVLASGAAFMLEQQPGTIKSGSAGVPFLSYTDLRGEKPPETSLLSMNYNSRIDFSNLSFINSGGMAAADLARRLEILLPFRDQIIDLFILSCTDKTPIVGREANLPENMGKSNYSMRWLYLNFADGLHLRYPASESCGKDFDGRRSAWYIETEKNPDKVVWAQPHQDPAAGNEAVITAAKAILSPQRTFLGAACADVALAEIRRIIEQDQSDRYFKKLLLLDDGRILINTANPDFVPKSDGNGDLVLPKFHQQELFDIMRKKKFGFESVMENGRETFYIYSYIEQMKWYYLVRVDQDTIRFQEDWKDASAAIVE